MPVLVAYASKYEGTRGIAERIAETLSASGLDATARSVNTVTDLGEYDAFVLGSAVYIGSWMKEALSFARQYQQALASRPVWLFSSGPLGASGDTQVHAVPESAVPKQIPELKEMLGAREHRVFFGVSDHTHFDLRDKVIYAVPGGKKLLTDGDFRDWAEIDTWAAEIAHALSPAAASA